MVRRASRDRACPSGDRRAKMSAPSRSHLRVRSSCPSLSSTLREARHDQGAARRSRTRPAESWPEGNWFMKVAPRLLLAMLALLGSAGCRTASTGPVASNRPPELRPRPTFDLDAFIAEHNENAERIRSLEARPSISVKIGPPGEVQGGGVDGRLALERPRNFKLELYHIRSTVADIGSNDDRFWFWFQNKKDKSVYVCDYADLSSTSLAVTYQPDWIAEALGLKTITPDEAAQVKTRPGPQPGTTALIFPATRSGSQSYSRIMLVSDQTRKVYDFRVFAADGKTMIAQATIKKYRESSGLGIGGIGRARPANLFHPREHHPRVETRTARPGCGAQGRQGQSVRRVPPHGAFRRADARRICPGQSGRGCPEQGIRGLDGRPGDHSRPRISPSPAAWPTAPDPGRCRGGQDVAEGGAGGDQECPAPAGPRPGRDWCPGSARPDEPRGETALATSPSPSMER